MTTVMQESGNGSHSQEWSSVFAFMPLPNPPRKGGLKKIKKVSPTGGDLEGAFQQIAYFYPLCLAIKQTGEKRYLY